LQLCSLLSALCSRPPSSPSLVLIRVGLVHRSSHPALLLLLLVLDSGHQPMLLH
jgi:hypothetical protein